MPTGIDDTAELTWMAVRADRRRIGVGSRLIDALVDRLRPDGRRILTVLTVSPMEPGEEPPDGYQTTRAFYLKNGFSSYVICPDSGTRTSPS
jgi:GNAT superfamily N-acetyltransferase